MRGAGTAPNDVHVWEGSLRQGRRRWQPSAVRAPRGKLTIGTPFPAPRGKLDVERAVLLHLEAWALSGGLDQERPTTRVACVRDLRTHERNRGAARDSLHAVFRVSALRRRVVRVRLDWKVEREAEAAFVRRFLAFVIMVTVSIPTPGPNVEHTPRMILATSSRRRKRSLTVRYHASAVAEEEENDQASEDQAEESCNDDGRNRAPRQTRTRRERAHAEGCKRQEDQASAGFVREQDART